MCRVGDVDDSVTVGVIRGDTARLRRTEEEPVQHVGRVRDIDSRISISVTTDERPDARRRRRLLVDCQSEVAGVAAEAVYQDEVGDSIFRVPTGH